MMCPIANSTKEEEVWRAPRGKAPIIDNRTQVADGCDRKSGLWRGCPRNRIWWADSGKLLVPDLLFQKFSKIQEWVSFGRTIGTAGSEVNITNLFYVFYIWRVYIFIRWRVPGRTNHNCSSRFNQMGAYVRLLHISLLPNAKSRVQEKIGRNHSPTD